MPEEEERRSLDQGGLYAKHYSRSPCLASLYKVIHRGGFLACRTSRRSDGQAEPGGPDGANLQAHFFDCTGPAGTPTSFDAELQHGGAWHLTDSRQIFSALVGFDETTNTLVVVTPGFFVNAVAAVTCRVVSVVNGHVFRVTGVLTPAASSGRR